MTVPTLEVVVSYLRWFAAEEDDDAEFLEECAARFDAGRESFLNNAEAHRLRARNIRASLEIPRRRC
jgi:hypothetical protein